MPDFDLEQALRAFGSDMYTAGQGGRDGDVISDGRVKEIMDAVERPAKYAVEYAFVLKRISEHTIYITRWTNHGAWIKEGFAVVIPVGSSPHDTLNPWYLSKDGWWRYKSYQPFETAVEAFTFVTTRKIQTLVDSYNKDWSAGAS